MRGSAPHACTSNICVICITCMLSHITYMCVDRLFMPVYLTYVLFVLHICYHMCVDQLFMPAHDQQACVWTCARSQRSPQQSTQLVGTTGRHNKQAPPRPLQGAVSEEKLWPFLVMACMVMAYIVMALCSYGRLRRKGCSGRCSGNRTVALVFRPAGAAMLQAGGQSSRSCVT